jgi:tripartite-type tricarboxylate transporter receptor subunit TctC
MKLLAQFVRRVSVPLLAGTLLVSAAWAQKDEKFPHRTIKIIVPFTPGGTTDVMARAIGQKLNDYWGQPVIVENKPGAAGWLGISAMAKSPADGYTIGVTISSIIYAKSLYTKLPFDIANDFEAVSMLSRSAIGLVVPAQFPADNLQDFIAHLRKNPGKYSYGSFGQGTTAHIFGETLNRGARIDQVHVPFKGAMPIVTDLLGGQLTSAFLDVATTKPFVQSGKLKVLAFSGTQRIAAFPNTPTFAEAGYKGFEPVGFFQVLAPAKTPKDIVRKLSDGIAKAVNSDDLKTRIQDMGLEVGGSTPEELATAIKVDGDIFDRAIKAANIQLDQN